MPRLAVVTTHPIQYYAPWFRHLAREPGLEPRVFYLWDFGVTDQVDPGFGHALRWDVPLLEGYAHEFVPNVSRRPGTTHFRGIDNPELPARLRAFGPDAVLCLGYNYATFARLLWRWDRRRSPLLLRGDSHRLVPRTGLQAWLKCRILAAVFRRFGAFLYVGAANRDYLLRHGVPPEKLFFSPHAVDNDRFLAAAEEARREAGPWLREVGVPPGRKVVLFVGKLEPKKRPLDLLHAFARAGLDDAALLYVGAGELEETLRKEAAAVPHVYFAPFQNQTRMPRAYAAADVVVLPSLGPGETWGLCVNEAMCLGRAVVVSSHVGCGRDLVEPGRTGRVFPAGDVDALARCLQEVFRDPQTPARLGAAGRERVGAYNYSRATEGLVRALEWLGRAKETKQPGARDPADAAP
jgi:glycosyltransferase involved in cell wall biosynthesis